MNSGSPLHPERQNQSQPVSNAQQSPKLVTQVRNKMGRGLVLGSWFLVLGWWLVVGERDAGRAVSWEMVNGYWRLKRADFGRSWFLFPRSRFLVGERNLASGMRFHLRPM
jgi:hypothetical protein